MIGFLAKRIARPACGLVPLPPGVPPGPPPDAPAGVALVILTKNHAAKLERCVRTLREQTDYPGLQLVVVDNGSTDPDAVAALSRIEGPDLRIVRSPGPFNYSALNNEGVRAAPPTPFVGLLNDDVYVPHGRANWLRTLVADLRAPGFAIAGPRLLYPDGRIQQAAIGLFRNFWGRLQVRNLFNGRPATHPPASIAREVSAVTGACMLVSRFAWERLGGLDETLPVVYNDVDFCLRARAAGLRVAYDPRATLTHDEGVSGRMPAKNPLNQASARLLRARHSDAYPCDPFDLPGIRME